MTAQAQVRMTVGELLIEIKLRDDESKSREIHAIIIQAIDDPRYPDEMRDSLPDPDGIEHREWMSRYQQWLRKWGRYLATIEATQICNSSTRNIAHLSTT